MSFPVTDADFAALPHRRNGDVLIETVPMEGRQVLDVGSGAGHLTRLMTRNGAHVVGIETNPRQLARAHAIEVVGDERFVEGRAEELPAENDSQDLVVFFNSLHHIPVDHMDLALSEAHRALKPGGILYVCEPVARGACFAINQPVHDETTVRAEALAAMERLSPEKWRLVERMAYVHGVRYRDYESWKHDMCSIDAAREAVFEKIDDERRRMFHEIGVEGEKGWTFDQPMDVHVFERL